MKVFVQCSSFNSWGWLDHYAPDPRGQFEGFVGGVRDPNGLRRALKAWEAVLDQGRVVEKGFHNDLLG